MTENRLTHLPFIASGIGFGILFLFVFFRLYLHGGNERLFVLILLLKVVGLYTSYVLVLGSMKVPYFRRFCPRSRSFDCERVIDSPAGMIFGILHTADLGVLYFGGSLLVLVFSAFSGDFYHQAVYLGIFNLFTLPYTVFSVSYQAFKVRKWCALCLIVQLIFWLEFWQFFPFIFANRMVFNISFQLLYPVVLGFGIVMSLWPLVRVLLAKAYGHYSVEEK